MPARQYHDNALQRFVVQEFREALKRMLGISFADIVLKWDEGFEQFLAEHKKLRKVRDPETLSYYRSLFKKYLEGKELSEELRDYVVNHSSMWLRSVFRHYIQYLCYKKRISPEAFGWIMEVVPSRSYKLDIRPYQISLGDVEKTMDYLRERRRTYYIVYRVMLESGAGFKHVLCAMELWIPGEVVEIPGIGFVTKRLVCFDDRGLR